MNWLKLSNIGKLLSLLVVIVIVLTYAIKGLYGDVKKNSQDDKEELMRCQEYTKELQKEVKETKNELIQVLKALNDKTATQIEKVDSLTIKK